MTDQVAAQQKVYRDKDLCLKLLESIKRTLDGRSMRFMEVCGTHTTAIFQSGLRSMLPENIEHISGPGCPVCVTHEAEVALYLQLSRRSDVIIATFGDLLRVPGPNGETLKHGKAQGANVEIVYSPLDCLKLAAANPDKNIVFLGIGFETTAPNIAATIITAKNQGISNFSVLSFHKLVSPAMRTILNDKNAKIDAFLLPGHVATIIGLEPFAFLPQEYGKSACVGGFEPIDILLALLDLAGQFSSHTPAVHNAYKRAVDDGGNPRALALMNQVFEPCDTLWRGFGKIPQSGLKLRPEYSQFDAIVKLDLELPDTKPIKGCLCGSVLAGRIKPTQCPLFAKQCTPANPVGPCMVSTEGSCAAFYKYGEH